MRRALGRAHALHLLSRCPLASPFCSRAASDILTHSLVEKDNDTDIVSGHASRHGGVKVNSEAAARSAARRPDAGAAKRSEAGRARSEVLSRLVDLDGEILAKLWPAQRVVAGQLVCKYLRTNLRMCAHVILQARNKCSVLDLARADFAQYEGGDVGLSLVSKSQHKVSNVMRQVCDPASCLAHVHTAVGAELETAHIDGLRSARSCIYTHALAHTHARTPHLTRAAAQVIFAALSRDMASPAWRGSGNGGGGDGGGLTSLSCRYNNMTPKCAARVASILRASSRLEFLDLSENPLLGAEFSAIAVALPSCPCLKVCCLSLCGGGGEESV